MASKPEFINRRKEAGAAGKDASAPFENEKDIGNV